MSTEPEIRTHRDLDPALCGEPTAVAPGRAEVAMTASAAMVADGTGLVHGGFVFGLADHAAMLAVNEPTVVLAKAEVRFLAPVAVDERLVARARVVTREDGEADAARPEVEVEVRSERGGEPERVFTGTFHCAVPRRHVLRSADRADRADHVDPAPSANPETTR